MKKKLFMLLALVMTAMTASAVSGYSLSTGTSDHGSIAFTVGGETREYAVENEVVTVTITPDENWSMGSVKGLWYAAGTAKAPRRVASENIDLLKDFELTPVEGNANAFTFTMKRANVEISATYRKMLTHQDITIADIQAVTYNGQAQTPAVSVLDGTTTLTLNEDYTVSYDNNLNAGTATATLVGTGNYSGTQTKTFTINAAVLTSVTLAQTEFAYNLFEPVAQTAAVSEVKAGALVVPAAQYDVEGNTQTEPGTYTMTVTGKTNFTGTVTAQFVITDQVVDGEAEETESGEKVDDVKLTLSVVDRTEQTLQIDLFTEGTATAGEDITVEIPAQINGWSVVSIAPNAMSGMTNVTDIVMPDTEKPIAVGANAFPGTATIHTTLALLDDYALMASLQQNYEAAKVVTTVTPANKYWTLGTGCDVIIPEGIDVYTVQVKNTAEVATEIIPEDMLTYSGEHIIKANNGVLLLGEAGQSYDLVAYSGRIASGMPVATSDNKDYGQKNVLEPVVEKKHYESGHYFVLQNNEFHAILAEGDEVKVPAGKAVLHLGNEQAGARARVLKIAEDVTGIEEVKEVREVNDDSIFDLSGRRVLNAQKGIYIINGKKVVVK